MAASSLSEPDVSLVGRDEELASLWQAVQRAQGGQLAVLMLAGEPGIGKTRLLDAAAARAAHAGAMCHDNARRTRHDAAEKGRGIMALRQFRIEKIELRVSAEAKLAIVAAAHATGKSISQFVLESALARAEDTLPDRRSWRSPISEPIALVALAALKERAPAPIIRDKGDPAASAAEDLAILDELGRLRREANRELS